MDSFIDMRTIENKKLYIPNTSVVWEKGEIKETKVLSNETPYFYLYKAALELAPAGGWNSTKVSELKIRLDLIAKLDVTADKLRVEENEFTILKEAVNYGIVINASTIEALNFLEYLTTLQKEEI